MWGGGGGGGGAGDHETKRQKRLYYMHVACIYVCMFISLFVNAKGIEIAIL